MRSRHAITFIVLLCFFTHAPLCLSESSYHIAVIKDGPVNRDIATLEQLLLDEIEALTTGEFEIRFFEFSGDWTRAGIEKAIDDAYAADNIDLVLVSGFTANQIAGTRRRFDKPTFLPYFFSAPFLGYSLDAQGSGVRNLNFLTDRLNLKQEFQTFQSITPFRKAAFIVDEGVMVAIPQEGKDMVIASALDTGAEVVFIPQAAADEDLVDRIPADVDAVMIAGLPRMSESGYARLVKALIARKLPSYTLIGSGDVARGILATNAPQTDWQRLARRNALNLQAVLLGEHTRSQPVLFRNKRELTINMETARQLGISLPFSVTAEAVLLNQDSAEESRTLTLKQAIEAGLQQNFSILANRVTLAESDEDVKEARARWLPQLSAEISHNRLSSDNLGVSSNTAAERATDGSLTLQQIIYSPDVAGNLAIQRALRDATAEDFRQLELDLINDISTAYFNLLKAENAVRLQRGYVLQNRENLSLARDRVQAGSAATSDEYRWVSELANARRTLLGAEAERERARDALNVLLNLPLDTPLRLADVSLEDPELLISNQRILDSVDNPRAFWQMGDFMIETGVEKSPELKQLSAQIRAIEAELDLNRKSGVIPDIALQVSQNHRLSDSRAAPFSTEGEDDWSAGISLTLPLLEGGGRKARVSRGRLEVRRLQTEYERLRQTIERNIRSNLHAIRASYPSIRLSRAAAEAARKTLEQVGDSYSKGTENIITLLDAQTSHLAAEQSALDAEYNFLLDLMNLQRSYGQFDYFLGEPARTSFSEALLQRLK